MAATWEAEASAQLFGLSRGYLSAPEIIAWADQLIPDLPSVPPEITAISVSPKTTSEIERRLHVVIGSFENRPDRLAVLRSMRGTLAKSPERAGAIAGALIELFPGEGADGADAMASEAYHVDYSFELADDHIQGNRESATAELRRFLEKWT